MESDGPRDGTDPDLVPFLEDLRAAYASRFRQTLLDSTAEKPDSDRLAQPKASGPRRLTKSGGHYELGGQIACGGMSVILKGHDSDLGRDVAVKVLDGKLAKRPEIVQRFVEEAQIGGQLQHPGIVPVYELGTTNDQRPYFTMKLIKGKTLASLLEQRQEPSEDLGRLLSVFEAVCETVAYAHSKGVLHRDLKPANIMVGAFREVQVVDWGLAKVLPQNGEAAQRRTPRPQTSTQAHSTIETVRSGSDSTATGSVAGTVLGTPAYMPPEQAQGEVENLDRRADVFALGAVLCEILTGGPPYQRPRGSQQNLVQLAARAKLDPARKRIQSSGADPALIDLCMRCLTASRAGRPADASEVAQQVHDYHDSMQERARKAELEAVESRLKVQEERRARKLTAALGVAVVTTAVVIGGSYLSHTKTREQQLEQERQYLDQTYADGMLHLRSGDYDKALVLAENARSRLSTSLADSALRDRTRFFYEEVNAKVEAVRKQEERIARNERLRERFAALRLKQAQNFMSLDRQVELDLDASFAEAFEEFGVSLDLEDLTPVLTTIEERGMGPEVAVALDNWYRLRSQIYGDGTVETKNLFYLATDLDSDPVRGRVREAIAGQEREAMLALAEPEQLSQLPPGSVWALGSAIWDRFPEDRDTVYNIYDLALPMHPNDFFLQSFGAIIYEWDRRHESALACRTAALAQRPSDGTSHMGRTTALLFLGRLTECVSAARAGILHAPEHSDIHYLLSAALLQLGYPDEALRSIERSLQLQEQADIRNAERALRYHLGLEEIDSFRRAIRVAGDQLTIGTLTYAMLDHPDPALRDPEFVLHKLEESKEALKNQDWLWVHKTLAYADLESWDKAEEAMTGQHQPIIEPYLVTAAVPFLRAVVYANLGREAEAHECYARGLGGARRIMGADETDWERSDLVRWRQKARTALGL